MRGALASLALLLASTLGSGSAVSMEASATAASAALRAEASATASTEQKSWKQRPVSRVVNLLRDMQAQLGKEGRDDEELYDQTACWCQTNDKAKSKAISDGTEHSDDLENQIQELAATGGQLGSQIASLEADFNDKTDSLAKATSMREKEAEEFHAEEVDLIGSVTALKGAIVTLEKHNPDSLFQRQATEQATSVIESLVKTHRGLVDQMLQPHQRTMMMSLLQGRTQHHRVSGHLRQHWISFLQQPQEASFAQQQQPATGEIFGILKQMHETFKQNLATSAKTEQEAKETYNTLKAAKTSEINAGKTMMATKSTELAEANEKNAQCKEDLKDTRDALASDNQFLTDLRSKCQTADREFAERRKTRQDETTAVSEAIEILASDDSKDLFSKSLSGPALLQVSRRVSSSRAATVLRRAAGSTGDRQLLALAATMRSDNFGAVKEGIDKLASQLNTEQADEVEQKDWCTNSLNENKRDNEAKSNKRDDLQTKLDDMKSSIDTLNEEIAGLKGEIGDMQVEMKKASQAREAENHEFQMTVMDQRATQAVLKKAIDRLQRFYAKKMALMQQSSALAEAAQVDVWQTPPASAGEYKKSSGASGVITLLETIRSDSKHMEKEATQAENDAAQAYTEFINNSNASVKAKGLSITNKLESRARLDAQRTHVNGDFKHTQRDLQALDDYASTLHGDCDFLIENFDARQSSRGEEIEALKQAESIFSGAIA